MQVQTAIGSSESRGVTMVFMPKFRRRENVIPDQDEISVPVEGLLIRPLHDHRCLFFRRPLHLFNVELSDIEVSMEKPVH